MKVYHSTTRLLGTKLTLYVGVDVVILMSGHQSTSEIREIIEMMRDGLDFTMYDKDEYDDEINRGSLVYEEKL